MSIASSPDCLFRPEDKALKMLFPSIEEPAPNAFDDFLNGDLYDLSDDDNNNDAFTDPPDFFKGQQLTGGFTPLSPVVGSATTDTSSPQPWRKGLWCLNQGRGASEIVIEKRRNNEYRSYENVGKAHLVQPAHYATSSPRSPPVTPSYRGTKKAVTSPRTAKARHNPHARPTFSREVTLSPTPMYAQTPYSGNMHYPETWQQDFQNFHLQLRQDRLPLSPPLSGSVAHQQISARHVNAAVVAQNAAAVRRSGSHLAVNSNAIDPGLIDSSHSVGGAQLPRNPYDQSAGRSNSYTHVARQPIPVWVSEDLNTSSNSQYSYQAPTSTSDSSHAQTWWSPQMTSINPQVSVPQQDYYQNLAAPIPQKLPYQILHQSTELHQDGLGIHYPDIAHPALPDLPASSIALSPPSHPMTTYPPLPPPSHTHFTQMDPFATPRNRRQASPSRSPSPSISPTNTARSLRQRSPTRTDYSHNRRKSLHKSGPIKDKDNYNSGKPPRTPRTPKTPTNGASGFDFVNFTPKDSVKLLSDVAPSGSSKTRARRDAEARDKRKRLSEAAVKAVRRAGGDVAALEKAILT